MLFTAFLMGLAGSLHCAAMCGALQLAVPVVGQSRRQIVISRIVFHLGRISIYAIIGFIFGIFGKSIAMAGFQSWLSILAGVAMISFLILGSLGVKSPMWKSSIWLRSVFGIFLKKRSYSSLLILGAANGLLPCGLVYMAATASIAAGSLVNSTAYMLLFGLGTLPMMMTLAFWSVSITQFLTRFRLKAIIPAAVTVIALSLILRGMGLGIPYLSPSLTDQGEVRCSACLKK